MATVATYSAGEKLKIFLLAGLVLAAIVGGSFAAGWEIGRMWL